MKTILLLLFTMTQAVAGADEEKFVFETWSKQKIEAFRASFLVPENRKAKDSRMIPIEYVRLPATGRSVGPPIVYLSGGPGGSGIMAINYRYKMFMAMRQYGDVIALDQRGTGSSNIVPECQSKQIVPTTHPISDQEFVEHHRKSLNECLAFWRHDGVDIAGYNTIQNAHDLDALRQHLGAEKIVLWGTSYGSHLALAALKEKEMENKIAAVVVSSVEGLNQTIKLPVRTDEYFSRLQAAIDAQPRAKAVYPDIKALMRRVHAKLDSEPVPLQLTLRDDSEVEYLLQRRDMQLVSAALISDPKSAAHLLGVYLALDRGVKPPFERIPVRLLPNSLIATGRPISMQGMPVAMDVASGMTDDRRSRVAKQSKTAILGSYLNYTLYFDGMVSALDLGDAFRVNPTSDVPVLVLSGTLDGRTYWESQLEAVSELKNAITITVKNGGHNLFDEPSGAVQGVIDQFMQGKPIIHTTITLDAPDMAPEAL